jgi:hypothetical protein
MGIPACVDDLRLYLSGHKYASIGNKLLVEFAWAKFTKIM